MNPQYHLIAGTAGQQLNLTAITIPGVTRKVSQERTSSVSITASVMTYPLCQMKHRDLLDTLNCQFCRLEQPFVSSLGVGKLYDWDPFGMLQVDRHSLAFSQSSNKSLIWHHGGLSGPLLMLEVNGSFSPVFDRLAFGASFFLQ